MLGRIALVFAGVILAGVLLNVYYLMFCFVFIFALGVENKLFLNTGYWTSLIAGAMSSFFLLRSAWPKSPRGGSARCDSENEE